MKSTEEQRSQTAFCAKTLGAAVLLTLAGVGSFLTSQLWGCAELDAFATPKIPRRRTPCNFQTGFKGRRELSRPPQEK
jgi:hypothetical protein